MSLVVMKFGGTSVEDFAAIERTAAIVAGRVAGGKSPVVVVSAMAKVTDQLLRAAAAASQGDRAGALAISSRLRARHRDTAAELVQDKAARAALIQLIDEHFDALDEVLRGLSAILELTPRISDLIVSYGERLSSCIVADAFRERGIDAAHADAREIVITDSEFQKAAPLDAAIDKRAAEILVPLVAQGKVPVMGGFIASNEAGVTTTLGRGGSDYTGALVGGALNAETIEIWTDVDGIMTADPRVCRDALRVKEISFEEAAELAYFGAKVLHPATILAGGKEEHSGAGAEQPQSLLRGYAYHLGGAALQEPVQVDRGEEEAEHHRHCSQPHVDVARLHEQGLRRFRQAQMPGRHGFDQRGFGFADGGLECQPAPDRRRPQHAGGCDLRGQEGARLHGGRGHPRAERHCRAGVRRHSPHQRAHDFAGGERDQHELHDRGGRRRRGGAVAARGVFPRSRPRDLRRGSKKAASSF